MIDPKVQKPEARPLRIFYPILFAIFPILSIYSANLAVVPLVTIFRPILLAGTLSVLIWLVAGLTLRNSGRGAVVSTVATAMAFLFAKVQELAHKMYIPPQYELLLWGSITALIAAIATWKFKWHKFANFLSVALVGISSLQIASGLVPALLSQQGSPETLGKATKSGQSRPDIIYIILDGYGRSDALKRALNVDNSKFIEGLEKRGFYVAKDSKSNYCQTELSVGSSLNLEFIQNLLPSVDKSSDDRMSLGRIIDHNAAAEYLRKKGYIFEAITTGFPPLQFDSADVNLRSRSGMTLIEATLFQLTPLSKNSATFTSLYTQRRNDISSALDAIASLSIPAIQPRFTIAHILAPHPPFVFGPEGQTVPQKGSYGFWDGSDYLLHISNRDDYRNGYAGQAEYLGKQLLTAIDTILRSSSEKPIIIIQGDHGSKLRLDQNSLNNTDLNECFPNLSAYLVPDSVRRNLYPSMTPVNCFRTLFNGLFGEDLKKLPDQSWYSTYPRPYAFTDVTAQIADHDKMKSIPLPR